MAARGAWALQTIEERVGFGCLLRSAASIVLTCLLAPALFTSYLVVSLVRWMWCRMLERHFPDVEPDCSPSVRAATDTRRNQGVVTLLLRVHGCCDPEMIRRRFQEDVLDLRDANGELQFPRLRSALTSRWGHYAWRTCNEFRLDSHIVVGSHLFRCRAVTEANIQDYVSDIVSKCLPAELPPWQLVLIPLGGTKLRFYALLRLHHLLVDEVAALHAALHGDWGWGEPLVPKPRALPYLTNVALGALRSAWLQLRLEHDRGLQPSLASLATTATLCVVDASYELSWSQMLQPWLWSRALSKQAARRGVTKSKVIRTALAALSPQRVVPETLRALVCVSRAALRVPLWMFRAQRTASGRLLVTETLGEVGYWSRVILGGPRLAVGELVRSILSPPPPLTSLCGRRVVAWSDPAPVELVERIAEAAGVTPVEVLLAAACGALREHYRRHRSNTPAIPVQPLGSSGVLLLPPLATHVDDPVAYLRVIARRVAASRNQPALLLASSWLRKHLVRLIPSLLVRLLLNCVTRRYAAIIMTAAPELLRTGPTELWGHTVDSVLLWRPPQANISVSLSLVRLSTEVRLAVMADQQLWPHHASLPSSFLANLRGLATALNVPRSAAATETLRHKEEMLED